MNRNIIFFAWNRSIPGREETSGQHFDEFVAYLGAQAQSGAIQRTGQGLVQLSPVGGRARLVPGEFVGDKDHLVQRRCLCLERRVAADSAQHTSILVAKDVLGDYGR